MQQQPFENSIRSERTYDSFGSGPNVNASPEISTGSQLASKAAQSSVIGTLIPKL
ncbi:MAG: hypothetical protein WCE45_07275 [Sedimentisphaerales bacterium]